MTWENYDLDEDEMHDPPRCECHPGGLDMDWDSKRREWVCSECEPSSDLDTKTEW